MRGTPEERFKAKWVENAETGCWEWTAFVRPDGYTGTFSLDGRLIPAYRASYLLHVGPIPHRWQIDHLCRNRKCVNPDHLEAVTCRENLRRRKPYWVPGRAKVEFP